MVCLLSQPSRHASSDRRRDPNVDSVGAAELIEMSDGIRGASLVLLAQLRKRIRHRVADAKLHMGDRAAAS
jgi:hypothetical protein